MNHRVEQVCLLLNKHVLSQPTSIPDLLEFWSSNTGVSIPTSLLKKYKYITVTNNGNGYIYFANNRVGDGYISGFTGKKLLSEFSTYLNSKEEFLWTGNVLLTISQN